jgi:anti-sigma-K factor RskA
VDIKAYIESGIIETYVLGMADAAEAAELERLSLEHPEIRAAIDAFELSLETHALQNSLPAPTAVKEQLMQELAGEFRREDGAKQIRMNSGATWRYWTAAAAILLIASAGLNLYLYNQVRSTSFAYQALLAEKNTLIAENQQVQNKTLNLFNSMQTMSDPSMIKVSMTGTPGHENTLATVFWDSKTRDVYLLANKLPAAAPDKQYQLWAIVDGKPVDAGLLEDCAGLCKLKNIPAAAMFAITLEKKGGSEAPTLDQMYVAGKVS